MRGKYKIITATWAKKKKKEEEEEEMMIDTKTTRPGPWAPTFSDLQNNAFFYLLFCNLLSYTLYCETEILYMRCLKSICRTHVSTLKLLTEGWEKRNIRRIQFQGKFSYHSNKMWLHSIFKMQWTSQNIKLGSTRASALVYLMMLH